MDKKAIPRMAVCKTVTRVYMEAATGCSVFAIAFIILLGLIGGLGR